MTLRSTDLLFPKVSHFRLAAAVSLLTTIATLGTSTVCAQVVPESGFETPSLGGGNFDYNPNDPTPGQSAWTFAGASGIAAIPGGFSGFLTPPEGSQVAFLQTFGAGASASVCQSVSGFQTGVEYFISAKLAHRVGCGSCNAAVDVHFEVDGNNAGDVPAASLSDSQFDRFSGWFVASSAQAQLCVVEPPQAGNGDSTSFVDDVQTGIFHIFIDGFEPPI